MILADKKESIRIANLIKESRPDIWSNIVKSEQEDGIYTEDEERKIYQYLQSLDQNFNTIDVIKLFFTIRCYVSYVLGINAYKVEF